MEDPAEDTHRPDAAEILARALGTAPRVAGPERPAAGEGEEPALPAPVPRERESAQDAGRGDGTGGG